MKKRWVSLLAAVGLLMGGVLPTAYADGERTVIPKPTSLLVLGDSIADGYMSVNPGQPGVARDHCYGTLIKQNLGLVENVTYFNQAVSGHTADDLLRVVNGLPGDWGSPDVISVSIGGNDVQSELRADSKVTYDITDLIANPETEENKALVERIVAEQLALSQSQKYRDKVAATGAKISEIVDALQAKFSGSTIVLQTVYNPFDWNDKLCIRLPVIENLNAAIKEVAAAHDQVMVLDVFAGFAGKGAWYINDDFIHPSVNGHKAIAALYEQLWTQAATVKFTGKFGEDIYTAAVTTSDDLKTLLDTVKAPALGGYTFCGWSENDADALWAAHSGGDIIVTPVYAMEEVEKRLAYTVAVGADIVSANAAQTVITDGQILSAYFDTRVELKLADGVAEPVAYWVLDGQKMAFGQSRFTFYVSGDNHVSVVLKSAAGSYTPEASVNLQQYTAQYNDCQNTYMLSVVAQTYVPAGSTAVEYGVYYTDSAAALQHIQAGTAAANTYVRVTSSRTGGNRPYMTHLLNAKAGRERYAMAYAVIQQADGSHITIYSPGVFRFRTPESGTSVTVTKESRV